MLPKFLKDGNARDLSDNIYKETGCFPFFYPNKVLVVGEPQDDRDSFYYIINGLYVLYHDFGKKFLDFFLQNKESFRLHVQNVKYLRTLIAHGNHDSCVYNKTIEIQFARYLNVGKTNFHWETGFFNHSSMTPENWLKACQKLVDDANNLYNYLDNWTKKTTSVNTAGFYYPDYFEKSFDIVLIKNAISYWVNKGTVSVNSIENTAKEIYNIRTNWLNQLSQPKATLQELYDEFLGIILNLLKPNPVTRLVGMI